MSFLLLSANLNLCYFEDGVHRHWHKKLKFCSLKDKTENIDGKVIKWRGTWDMHLCRQHGQWGWDWKLIPSHNRCLSSKGFPWLSLRPSLLAGKYCFNNLPGVNVSVTTKDKITMIQFPGEMISFKSIPHLFLNFSKVSCIPLNSDF